MTSHPTGRPPTRHPGRSRLAALAFLAVTRVLADSPPSDSTVVSHPYLGIDLRLPEEWKIQVAPTGFLLESPNQPASVAVLSHAHSSLGALRQALQAGMREAGEVELQPEGDLTSFGESGLAGFFRGTSDGEPVGAYGIFLLSPYGGGATVLAALPNGVPRTAFVRAAETVAASIDFSPRVAADPLDPWKERLLNCRLTHLPALSPLPDKEEPAPPLQERVVLDLCDNGRFHLVVPDPAHLPAWTGRSETAADAGPGPTRFTGDWFLVKRELRAWLRLQFPDGARHEFLLSLPDGSTYLNDLHVYRTYTDALRIEDVPDCE